MKRQNVKVVLTVCSYRYASSWNDFLDEIKHNLDEAPTGSKILFDLESENDGYGSSEAKLEIYYNREETDAELSERLNCENVYKNQRILEAKKLLGIT